MKKQHKRIHQSELVRKTKACHDVRASLSRRLARALVLCGASINIAKPTLGLQTTRIRNHRAARVQRMVLTTPEVVFERASTTKLLDDLIDESVRTSARRPIIMQFDPSSGWIWKRWKGTIFSETWDSCVYRMLYAGCVYMACSSFPAVKETLSGFSILWGQLLSVTTFTLTFFVNQSYSLWKTCTTLSRRLQGRLHDLDLNLATHATRKPSDIQDGPSEYTAASRQVLELISRYVRLFNLLTYASFTRSHRPMLTPRGMRRLVERGLMTSTEREVLVEANIPATQRHNAVLLWIIRSFVEGTEAGHFKGGSGFEQQFIEKAHVLRSAYGAIGDELQARMPLAYAHIVQVLVDLVLWMYPFMAYSAGMSGFICVLGTGLLTIGYQGLFDLAKQFLDPYDNENYGKGEDPLVVDTLIAETNAGSVRWMNGLAQMPVPAHKMQEGDLSDFMLPVRGYSLDELYQIEEERRELQEQREKAELERQREEEHEMRIREAADAMMMFRSEEESSPVDIESAYRIVYNNTGDRLTVPGLLQNSSTPIAETVSSVLFSQNMNASSLQTELVPEGTAPATGASFRFPFSNVAQLWEQVTLNPDSERDPGSDVLLNSSDVPLSVPEAVDSDETHQDGLQTEELKMKDWIEEVESAKETIRTYEEYVNKVQEIKDAEERELLETEAIMNAAPGTDIEFEEEELDFDLKLLNSTEPFVSNTEGYESDLSESYSVPNDFDDAEPCMISDSGMNVSEAVLECEQQRMDARREEFLETEAILNAPMFAEIETLKTDDENGFRATNNTESDDDLTVLEMDATDVGGNAVQTPDASVEASIGESEATEDKHSNVTKAIDDSTEKDVNTDEDAGSKVNDEKIAVSSIVNGENKEAQAPDDQPPSIP